MYFIIYLGTIDVGDQLVLPFFCLRIFVAFGEINLNVFNTKLLTLSKIGEKQPRALCFSPFSTFDNVRISFTKRQDMFPVILALCFVLKIFRCSEHYAPNLNVFLLVII